MGRLKDDHAAADNSPGPGEMASRSEIQRIVLEALAELPEEYGETFRMKFQDELTYREISMVTGKSLGKVNKLITTALSAIRDRLGAGGKLAEERSR